MKLLDLGLEGGDGGGVYDCGGESECVVGIDRSYTGGFLKRAINI